MTDRNEDLGQLDDDIGVEEQERWEHTVVNDAVAGETVWPGPGDGNDGPTGGTAREQEPIAAENDLAGEPIDLDDGA
ncbi:hypothetical protein [Agromyces aerolatus]|uniref:hypothetical protein n=1 Tax=Agromyces sp. LY-1074 TaxID=3074080 RepID=UPI002863E64C|nr:MULTISPECIES: hypothetical protein [unclassified Agromyces]MDR5701236.1 hypothetical protein [Agromyces sp. LY-1074]MDR5706888.1 hypothetical protein [Agromyces sp. LY-1358]